MRLWSIHPKYLDSKWLVACWREGLLAKNVLLWNTKWYKNHPQLNRFKASFDQIKSIDAFLYQIYLEAKSRGYNFTLSKINKIDLAWIISVTKWQLDYEFSHLLSKLELRDNCKYRELLKEKNIESNSIFKIIDWEIEKWEIIN